MAIRQCPQCLTRVPAGQVVAYSNGMECPGCKIQLEVSVGSRILATTLGLVAAALVWRAKRMSGGILGWVLPIVYAFFAFSVVAPLFLMATADLRSKPAEPPVEPEPMSAASHGHGGEHD